MILVDSREPKRVVDKLRNLGLDVYVRNLEVGDYLIKHSNFEVVVERKDVNDFLNSIVDGRIFRQCHVLSARYSLSFLIIVGSLNDALTYRNFNKNAVIAAIVSIAIKNNPGQVVPLIFEDEDEFCYTLKSIESKLKEGEFRIIPRVRKYERPEIAMLTAIPGIGEKKALALLEHFGSINRIVNASVAELMRVEGIGEKKAREIYRIFRRKFLKSEEV